MTEENQSVLRDLWQGFRETAVVVLGGIALLAAYIVTNFLGFSSPFHGASPDTASVLTVPRSGQDEAFAGEAPETPTPGDDAEQEPVLRGNPAVPEDPAFCSNPFDWTDAASAVGEFAYVQGPLISIRPALDSEGAPTFLNIGADYPDPRRFTIVIWGDGSEAASFAPPPALGPLSPEEAPTVCIRGDVRAYRGSVQMTLLDQSQMRLAR